MRHDLANIGRCYYREGKPSILSTVAAEFGLKPRYRSWSGYFGEVDSIRTLLLEMMTLIARRKSPEEAKKIILGKANSGKYHRWFNLADLPLLERALDRYIELAALTGSRSDP